MILGILLKRNLFDSIKIMKQLLALIVVFLHLAGCSQLAKIFESADAYQPELSNHTILLISDLKWEPLNPARGDKSPQAGTLWGDRNDAVATGFLVKFVDGFSSPPHIHNTTYRAVVISGLIHNDDPDAKPMWMPPGSFWTQPKGEAHITAAKGEHNMALVEINVGPYLVLPTAQAFDRGERPVNIDASNIVWLDLPNTTASPENPKIAYLWGSQESGQVRGAFVKLPRGLNVDVISSAASFHAVVISGDATYHDESPKSLTPGSYFGSEGQAKHMLSSGNTEECIIYIRSDDEFIVNMNK